MTILRQAYKRDYVCLPNSLTQNNNLSLRARGLMAYLLSLPDDWTLRLAHLIKVMPEGRHILREVLKELKAVGYIHLAKLGFNEGWQYFVFPNPVTEEEFKEFLRTVQSSNCSNFELFEDRPLQSTNIPNKYQEEANIGNNNNKDIEDVVVVPPDKEEREKQDFLDSIPELSDANRKRSMSYPLYELKRTLACMRAGSFDNFNGFWWKALSEYWVATPTKEQQEVIPQVEVNREQLEQEHLAFLKRKLHSLHLKSLNGMAEGYSLQPIDGDLYAITPKGKRLILIDEENLRWLEIFVERYATNV